jgi:hypothetical protein
VSGRESIHGKATIGKNLIASPAKTEKILAALYGPSCGACGKQQSSGTWQPSASASSTAWPWSSRKPKSAKVKKKWTQN